MIIVTTHLVSANTGEVTELARMHICNVGGTHQLRNYSVEALRGRSTEQLNKGQVQRSGRVDCHPSERVHVWNLVAKGLAAMGYGERS